MTVRAWQWKDGTWSALAAWRGVSLIGEGTTRKAATWEACNAVFNAARVA